MDIRETRSGSVDMIHLVQDRNHLRTFVNMIINLLVL
jgi:hypothetical protein